MNSSSQSQPGGDGFAAATEAATTAAGDWWDARQQGRRLPEHQIPCELCGNPVWPGPYTHEVFDASDVYACNQCIEEML